MSLLSLLVVVILLGLVYWAVHRLAGAFGLPAPVVALLDVLLVVLGVLWLLGALTGVGPQIRLT